MMAAAPWMTPVRQVRSNFPGSETKDAIRNHDAITFRARDKNVVFIRKKMGKSTVGVLSGIPASTPVKEKKHAFFA